MNTGSIFRPRAKRGWPILGTTLVGMVLSLGLTAPSSAQTITLARPNGGENWTVGEKHAIHWNWSGSISLVNIEYSTDGGSTWSVVLSNTANDGDAVWITPNTLSATCYVKVASASNPDVYDVGDASFTIARPEIAIRRPNGGTGGESWTVGEKRTISWDWTGSFGTVDIEYSSDGGNTWNVVLSGVNNDGRSLWTVPNTPSSTCRLKITNTSDTGCSDVSDSDFSIIRPTVSVVRPNGGETYYEGKDVPIHWTTSGAFSTVRLEYSTNGGSSWTEIVSSTTNDGHYCWNVPSDASSTTCKVRATDTDDLGSYGVSAANFTIADTIPSDSLLLFSPRTGDAWLVGKHHYICWTHAGANSSVKLEYATDGGGTWNLISSSTANDGVYEWNVPSDPSEGCRIRVSNTANPNVYDVSDQFTIEKQWIVPTSPTADDAWLVGRYYYITWNWGGQFSDARLQYSTDRGTTWSDIIASTNNGGYYKWQVAEPPSANSQIKITNTDNSQAFGLTDIFRAASQAVTITSPLTGDVWQAGRKYYITWNYTGQFSDVNLSYSTDRGTSWSIITGATNNGSYEWSVPNVNSVNCRIKATRPSGGALYGITDVFTILPKTGISENASSLGSQSLVAEPNPLHGRTILRYVLTDAVPVDMAVFDASGRQVRALVGAGVSAGTHSVAWDRRDESGKLLPSGVYFCRLAAGESRSVTKLILQ